MLGVWKYQKLDSNNCRVGKNAEPPNPKSLKDASEMPKIGYEFLEISHSPMGQCRTCHFENLNCWTSALPMVAKTNI